MGSLHVCRHLPFGPRWPQKDLLGCWRPSAASNLSLSLVAESPHGPHRSAGAPSSATAGTESARFWRGRCAGRTWPQKCSHRLRGRLVRAQGPGRPLLPTSRQQRATGRGGAMTALSVCWEPRCPRCQPAVWVTLPASRTAVCTHLRESGDPCTRTGSACGARSLRGPPWGLGGEWGPCRRGLDEGSRRQSHVGRWPKMCRPGSRERRGLPGGPSRTWSL